MFNQICINEEMLPRCTYFKLYDLQLINITRLVKGQITPSKEYINKLNPEAQKIRELESSIKPEQLQELDYRFSVIIIKSHYQRKLTLQKKLNNKVQSNMYQ